MKIRHLSVTTALVLGALAVPTGGADALAAGRTITFGEDPSAGVAQYEALGVTFAGSLWIGPGLSLGDDGSWGLEGTNDSYFAGINGGGGYDAGIHLDEWVASASIDVARSNGSIDGTITLTALLDGEVVDTDEVVLGEINEWSTLSVTGPLDELQIVGTGTSFHPFGLDNLVLGAGAPVVPPTTEPTVPATPEPAASPAPTDVPVPTVSPAPTEAPVPTAVDAAPAPLPAAAADRPVQATPRFTG